MKTQNNKPTENVKLDDLNDADGIDINEAIELGLMDNPAEKDRLVNTKDAE